MRGRPGLAGLAAGLLVAAHSANAAPPPLERASIAEIDAAMADGRLTAEQLVRFYLDRIARLDRGGPGLHAVISLNPEALLQARALDAERRSGHVRGPLHGVPILLKDNIETADRTPTTAGSLALAANVTGHDAALAARLRAAGAVILGKANLTEWANFRSSHATSGWTPVGGLVRNPYALDRSACGSSSGSAVAVAAGLAAAAVGSETDGSVTCPSSMEGVTGLKPSLGLIARTRIVPISHSQDTAGPIAHTAADAALLAAAMAGSDPADPPSQAPGAATAAAALAQVRPADLRGLRLGVLRFTPDSYVGIDALYAQALDRLRAAGAVLVEVKLPDEPRLGTDETLVLETEMKADMAAYLAGAAPAVQAKTLADLIAFNRATSAETRLFGQDLFEASQATKGLQDPAYQAARAESLRLTGAEGIDRLLVGQRLDALVSPTTGPTWKVDLVYGDAGPASVATFPAVAGYPHVTTPMGLVRGLPVGLSFIGPKWSDARVLALAEAWEAMTPPLPAPSFPATVDPLP
ncbi:amidase [Caulobacter sp. S45]|uniref:amidase n=1 Tax=Caulobacter sp. S45 TaxID=1641861 RepID=UPI001576FC46|nr:amidase [Caulobacter sp. S45]